MGLTGFCTDKNEVILAQIMVIVEWIQYLTVWIIAIYTSTRFYDNLVIKFSKSHPFYPVFLLIFIFFMLERAVSFGACILLTNAIAKKRFDLCDKWFCIQKYMLNVILALSLVNLFYMIMAGILDTIVGFIIAIIYRIFSLKVMLDFMKVLQLDDPV